MKGSCIKIKKWIITPMDAPAIIRNCSKCGNGSKFICSGNFRVNANGRNIDVWLIYKCEECDTTWNMEILSRAKPTQINKELYQNFLKNDYQTSMVYAFNQNTLNLNKAVARYDDILYKVEKVDSNNDDDVLEIVSSYNLGLRLDKLLSDELNISRTKVKSMFESLMIESEDPNITSKTKVKGTIKLKIKEIST